MNVAAKLFIALVIVAAGYCIASLFGPAQLSANVGSWNAKKGSSGSEVVSSGEDPSLLLGHVRLTPDTTLTDEVEKPPSAVLKGTIVPSPNAGASAGLPADMPEPAPLWLSAHAVGTLDPPDIAAAPAEHRATIRADWSADENRTVSPAYFADERLGIDRSLKDHFPQDRIVAADDVELDDVESGTRTHIIIDGDSLARLAERYLDDSARWNEIFTLNRDQLTDPGLLPIGVELKLPSKSAQASNESAGEREALTRGMVKVDPATISANQPPEARLLRPLTAKPIYEQYHFTVAD